MSTIRSLLYVIAAILGLALAAGPVAAQSRSDIFHKPWTPLSASEQARFVRAVGLEKSIGVPADWLSLGQQPLSWSPGASLIRVHGDWQPGGLFLYFLRDKAGKYAQLTGASPVIHTHNAAYPPLLTAQTVRDYIWFFGFFVRGADGPFLPVETAKDTFLPKGITKGDFAAGYKSAYDIPRPMKCTPAKGKHLFTCDVLIMYSNAMFEAVMQVQPSGMIAMSGDTPVAADMNFKIAAPITLAAVGSSFRKPSAPPKAPANPTVSGLPADAQRIHDALTQGKPLKLDGTTTPFLAGMASSMLERCGLPRNSAARLRLQAFTASSSITAMMGGDYSNRNIGTAMKSAAQQQAMLAAGATVTNQLGCGDALDALGNRISEIIKANSAQGSRFVDSCEPVHGRRSCTCLANLARPVIPGIASRTYHRSDIAELIERNPMTALMVAMSCGIVNY
ncbi:hypothetical protein [Tropicibacter oceani]|uniref:Uncharacterized protein n=1 Tax=Tropicibacter oceani TaxID=3058420 RepID=A0ABY8QG74_9RHOB|nr:hypothetical protein [Tropicibacter oceani]WGW03626.1 hypothetical protein QF118_17165 [Tropicibacter oceani]